MKVPFRVVTLLLVGNFVSLVRGFAPAASRQSLSKTTTQSRATSSKWPRTRQEAGSASWQARTTTATPSRTFDKTHNHSRRPCRDTSTALAATGGPADGSDRGNVLLGLSFLIAVWIFSIPPEFRRAHFCTSDVCLGTYNVCFCL